MDWPCGHPGAPPHYGLAMWPPWSSSTLWTGHVATLELLHTMDWPCGHPGAPPHYGLALWPPWSSPHYGLAMWPPWSSSTLWTDQVATLDRAATGKFHFTPFYRL